MEGNVLELLEPGKITIVGFRGEKFLGGPSVRALRDELAKVLDGHRPEVIQFDLTGVGLMTSEMLGFLVSLRNKGLDIVLYNPSENVRGLMKTTRLDSVFELIDGEQ